MDDQTMQDNTDQITAEETQMDQPAEVTQEDTEVETQAAETSSEETTQEEQPASQTTETTTTTPASDTPNKGRWYVVHTYSGHENRVATSLKQRIESEGLDDRIFDILVPTQEKIEIKGGKKETVKEKIFPGYILVKMALDDTTWLAIRTTQGVTSFVGALNKPTPISEAEVASIVKFMQQGGQPTYKDVIVEGDTVKIIDGPFGDMIGKAEEVDKEKGKVKVLVSIFGRETPVELDFLQVQKL